MILFRDPEALTKLLDFGGSPSVELVHACISLSTNSS